MPMKIYRVGRTVPTRKLPQSGLLKSNIVHESKANNANTMINDSHFGFWNKFIFKTLDVLNPILVRHPKFADKIIQYSEKFIKSDNIVTM